MNRSKTESRLWTLEQVGAATNVSVDTVERWIADQPGAKRWWESTRVLWGGKYQLADSDARKLIAQIAGSRRGLVLDNVRKATAARRQLQRQKAGAA